MKKENTIYLFLAQNAELTEANLMRHVESLLYNDNSIIIVYNCLILS